MITIKQHDTARKISDTLTLDGVAIDLTGASVAFIIKPKGSGVAVRRVATITDPTAGKVEYALVAEDTATAGVFIMEWEITLSGPSVLTVPDDSYHEITIKPDLA